MKEIKQSMSGAGRAFAYSGCAVAAKGNALMCGNAAPLMLAVSGDLAEKKQKPKPALITPRFGTEQTPEDTLRTKLYSLLVAERSRLAALHSIPPYMVITEQALLQLAETRPTSRVNLKRVQGFNEVGTFVVLYCCLYC